MTAGLLRFFGRDIIYLFFIVLLDRWALIHRSAPLATQGASLGV